MQRPKMQNYFCETRTANERRYFFAWNLRHSPIECCAPFMGRFKWHGTYYARSCECQFYVNWTCRIVHHRIMFDPTHIKIEINSIHTVSQNAENTVLRIYRHRMPQKGKEVRITWQYFVCRICSRRKCLSSTLTHTFILISTRTMGQQITHAAMAQDFIYRLAICILFYFILQFKCNQFRFIYSPTLSCRPRSPLRRCYPCRP